MNNKYKFLISQSGHTFDFPIELKWNFTGVDDSIDEYQKQVVKEIIGKPADFEILRFANKPYSPNNSTKISYEFNFYSTGSTSWVNSYTGAGFNNIEIYYFAKEFSKSFFKLDFYDSPDTSKQINYFTVIIPTQQGLTQPGIVSPLLPQVQMNRPSFVLDYVGDKEGFFLYWLRNPEFLDISTFYMSAKFFDAKNGFFIKMMNSKQSVLPNEYNFDPDKYFYYKVTLDRTTATYQVFDTNNQRIGTTNPIKWYEYVNP